MKSSSEPQYVKQKKADFLVVERGSAEIRDSHFEAEKIWNGLFRLIFAVKLQNIQGKPWSFTYTDCPGNRNSALWKLLPKEILLEKSLKIFRIKEVKYIWDHYILEWILILWWHNLWKLSLFPQNSLEGNSLCAWNPQLNVTSLFLFSYLFFKESFFGG